MNRPPSTAIKVVATCPQNAAVGSMLINSSHTSRGVGRMNDGYRPIITMSCHAAITLKTNSTIEPARSRGTYLRGIGTSPKGLRIRITRLDLAETAMLASVNYKTPKIDHLRGEAHD